jgi:hypothetical protein
MSFSVSYQHIHHCGCLSKFEHTSFAILNYLGLPGNLSPTIVPCDSSVKMARSWIFCNRSEKAREIFRWFQTETTTKIYIRVGIRSNTDRRVVVGSRSIANVGYYDTSSLWLQQLRWGIMQLYLFSIL